MTISIKLASSSLIAIKEPLISKALKPFEGLSRTGVITTPLTSPKSKSLRLRVPFTA